MRIALKTATFPNGGTCADPENIVRGGPNLIPELCLLHYLDLQEKRFLNTFFWFFS